MKVLRYVVAALLALLLDREVVGRCGVVGHGGLLSCAAGRGVSGAVARNTAHDIERAIGMPHSARQGFQTTHY